MIYVNKWATFVACIPMMLSSGVTYSFAIWSESMKEAYGLDQGQIQAIGSACNLGGYSGIIAGILYDRLEHFHRLGPRLTILIGACTNLIGYLGLWAAATRQFEAQYWQLLLLAFIACNGGTWADTSGLVTNVRNFPNNRGMVVGILKSGVGLSASFYTAMYLGILQPDANAYLLFLALVPSIAALLAALVTNHVPFVQQSELQEGTHVFTTEGRFLFSYQIVGTLAVYLMSTALAGGIISVTPTLRVVFTAGAGLLLLPLLLVPQGSGGLRTRPAHPLWRDAEEGHLAPRIERRRHLRTGRLVPVDSDSMQTPLLAGEAEDRAQHQQPKDAGSGGSSRRRSQDKGSAAGAVLPSAVGAAADGAAHAVGGDVGTEVVRHGGELGSKLPAGPAAPQHADAQQHPEQQLQRPSHGSPAQQRVQPVPPLHPATTTKSFRKERRELAPCKGPACPNLSPLQCLASLDFWLLFGSCCVGMGAGLVFNNNLAQLVRALGGPADGQDVFVSLFGVMNCAGRLVMGYIPERMLHSSGVPRPVFLVGMSSLTTAVCLFLACARLPALYPLSLVGGLAFGAHWSLMPSLASELFGLHSFATNYALLQLAPAVGSVGLASRLAGYLYELSIQRHHWKHGTTCVGQDCFQLTFLIIAALGVLATGCSTWLYLRTREQYYSITFSEVHQHDQDMERLHLLPSQGE